MLRTSAAPERDLKALRVLILEDSASDAELVVRELRRFGYDPLWTRVETEEEFRAHIAPELDIVLADYTLPQFDAPGALSILQELGLSIPFIIVTGTITEETAVTILKLGADDFLLKDRLARLGPAISNALQQRQLRDQRRRAQQSLVESEARYRRLATSMSALVVELDRKGTILFVNEAVTPLAGFSPEALLGQNAFELFFPSENRDQFDAAARILARGEDLRNYVTRCRTRNGSWISLEWNTANERDADGRLRKIIAFGVDITERESAALRIRQLAQLNAAISGTNEALVRSHSPDEVFAAICRACVEHGGFSLAWVGLADTEMRRIVVANAFGPAIDYLDGICVSTEADDATGCGPAGIAYREKRVYICNDFSADPATAPWRERAARYGLAASVSLPFCQDGEAIGTLTVHGRERHVFDQEAVALLERMADNISYAMDQFKSAVQRKKLEEGRLADAQRLAELSRRVVAVQEEERRRLAGELHDRTSPNLSAVSLNFGTIAADLGPARSDALDARLADTRKLLADTIAGIRDVCAELRPAMLDYAGLLRALQEYADLFSRRNGIAVEVSCTDPAKRRDTAIESALFRIAQEALTNCAKHAKANVIKIELIHAQAQTVLTITDNGKGFDVAALGKSGNRPGLGLFTMRERAEFAGGEFSLESKPGHGTRITVII